jgi:predicted nucleotidyltransferase
MMGGLTEKDWALIISAIKSFASIEQAVLFGSRAKGNYKNGSDVDLAIKGKAVSYEAVVELSEIFNESVPLPYFFDVVDYAQVDKKLREHIDRVGIEIMH